MQPSSLSIENQLELFSSRGLKITDVEKNKEKLRHISYYRLKEFARPYSKIEMDGDVPVLRYQSITFDDLVKRYYQDKNLRIHLLHAIEKVEVSLKRNLSFILGERYGAFGYLEFSSWSNRDKFSRYQLEEKQFYFKRDLLKTVAKSSLADLENLNNFNADGFPSIWLAAELLMFGNLVYLIGLMSHDNQKRLARYYDCTPKELISWLKCLNFVRNICAHNTNIIDIQLQTKPILRKEWGRLYLTSSYDSAGRKMLTNRLSAIILITVVLVNRINPKYNWKNIRSSIATICKDSDSEKANRNARLLGFHNAEGALDLRSFALGKL